MSGTRRKPRARCPWLSPWAWTTYGSVALLPFGVISVSNLGKEVELVVDRQTTAMRTFSGTVYDLLGEAGVSVGPHDYVSASGLDEVVDGSRIVVRHARRVTLVVDEPPVTVGAAPVELSVDPPRARLSAPGRSAVPVSRRTVQVVDGGGEAVYTTRSTVREVLREAKVRLRPGDKVTPSLDSFPVQGTVIKIKPMLLTR